MHSVWHKCMLFYCYSTICY